MLYGILMDSVGQLYTDIIMRSTYYMYAVNLCCALNI